MGNRWQLVPNWNKKTDAETLARECPDDEDAKQRIEEDYWGDELEDRLWHATGLPAIHPDSRDQVGC